jgi:gas vesicle protein
MGSFLLGLGVGMVGGILMAPQPGEHYRRMLGEKASEGYDYLKNKTEGLRDSASGAVEKGREVMTERLDRAYASPSPVYQR